MREEIENVVLAAVESLGLQISDQAKPKISVTYPDSKLGDYSSNAAFVLAKEAKINPVELAKQIVEKIDESLFEKIETAGPGFINFILKKSFRLGTFDVKKFYLSKKNFFN